MEWAQLAGEIALSEEEWEALLAAAAELDLVRGGTFRARQDAIAFYCSPENHPEGWDVPFPPEDLPRRQVGEIERAGEGPQGEVRLRLNMANWERLRAIERGQAEGDYAGRTDDYAVEQERAISGRPADRRWLLQQLETLRRYAAGDLLEG